jgi:hypothetical protein
MVHFIASVNSPFGRVCQLELRVFSISKPPGKIEERVKSHERGLESLRQEVERQRESIDR